MLNWTKVIFDGVFLALIGSAMILGIGRYNPRLFLNKGDMPADILAAAPPKTEKEKRQSLYLGIPLVLVIIAIPFVSTLQFQQLAGEVALQWLFLHAFIILMIFNLFDLLVLDLLVFCTITPESVIIPGTKGLAGYKDYGFHLRQHARSFVFMALLALLIAGVVSLL